MSAVKYRPRLTRLASPFTKSGRRFTAARTCWRAGSGGGTGDGVAIVLSLLYEIKYAQRSTRRLSVCQSRMDCAPLDAPRHGACAVDRALGDARSMQTR